MDFRILGPLEVHDGSRQLALGGAKQRALLALLLLHANEVVSSDRLLDELWPDAGPGEGTRALQVAISRLRKTLEPGRSSADEPRVLLTRPAGYELRISTDELDLHRFDRLAAEARVAASSGDPRTAARLLKEGLALWRGPPLLDLTYASFARAEIARLEELRSTALEEYLAARLELGQHAQLVGELESLVVSNPLRERLRALLILALYRSGRQAEALEAYADARRVLVEQLGIEPSRELQELQAAVLAQDPALDHEARVIEPEPPEASVRGLPASGQLVGRDREMAVLADALERAISGHGGSALISGEPGIGKSRLAEELASLARRRGAEVLIGRCWEAGGAPAYWPWVQVLRRCLRYAEPARARSWLGPGTPELAAILPELRALEPGLSEAPELDQPGARFRLFESVVAFLTGAATDRPLTVLLDDLHAADASSLLLLRFVARELSEAPMLVVGCYRDTEVGPDLTETLAELTRTSGTKRVALKGLARADTDRVLELTAGQRLPDDLAAKVHDGTGGNPLFAGEVARLLVAEDGLESGDRLPVPEGVSEAIARRLDSTSESCREVLGLASVLGREFDLDALERISTLGQDDLFAALEEALQARMVGEVPDAGGRLRFSHVLIRDALYEAIPPTRRLRLHGRIGAALEELYAGNLDPHVAELAHHYLQAGAGGAEKALVYATAAGDRAAVQLANEEAARHYRSALDVLESRGPADARKACDLLLSLGDALSRAGRGSEAKKALRSAAAIARAEGWPDRLARAALSYGGRFGWVRASTDPALAPLLEQALAAVGNRDSHARVRLLARLAAATRDEPSRERRIRLADEAVAIARRTSDPTTLAYAIEGRFVAVEGPDSATELIEQSEQLIALAEQIGDKELLFGAHDHRLNALWSLAERAALDVELATLEVLADELRQPAQRWALGTSRTMLALMEGEFDRAEQLIAETLAVGQEAEAWNAVVSQRLALFVLRRAQGRLAELEEAICRSVHEYPALLRFRCALVHLYGELGRAREAGSALADLLSRDLANEHVDAEWLFSMSLLPDPCAFVGDRDGAAQLYSLLAPYGERYAEAPVETTFGSVARGLGVLATTLGRFDEAEGHFASALDIERRMRARPWMAHARHDLAAMLLARGRAADRGRATELLDQAIAAYRELGMDAWARRAGSLL